MVKYLSLLLIFSSLQLTAQADSTMLKQLESEMNSYRDSVRQQSVGKPFYEFTATSTDGHVFSEKQLIGKVTMVNFFYRHCAPCIRELPALKKLYEALKDNPDFQFLAFTSDPVDEARQVASEHLLPFVILPIAQDECYRLNRESGFPTNMVVDKQGNIAYFKMGADRTKELEQETFTTIEMLINQLLAEE